MKELDLDELHQAVNAIMDDTTKPKAKKATHKVAKKSESKPHTHAEAKPAPVVAEQPAHHLPPAPADDDKDDKIEVKRVSQKLAIPPRRRGVAMDIVQSAQPASASAPSSRPSREAPTLAPTKPITPEPIPPMSQPVPAPVAKEEPKAEVSDDVLAALDLKDVDIPAEKPSILAKTEDKKPADASQWPDPLEFHGFNDETPQDEPAPVKPAQEPAPTLEATDEELEIAPVPDDQPDTTDASPFVATKVQKRPLGAFTADSASRQTSFQSDTPKATTPQPAVLAQFDQKELSPEVMAVESTHLSSPEPAPASPVVTAPASDRQLDTARQMTIPQQYQTTTKTPVDDTRPVFDTEDYHAPLIPEHVPHRNSVKKWVLLLMLLILLAAGVVAYLVFTGALSVTLPL